MGRRIFRREFKLAPVRLVKERGVAKLVGIRVSPRASCADGSGTLRRIPSRRLLIMADETGAAGDRTAHARARQVAQSC